MAAADAATALTDAKEKGASEYQQRKQIVSDLLTSAESACEWPSVWFRALSLTVCAICCGC